MSPEQRAAAAMREARGGELLAISPERTEKIIARHIAEACGVERHRIAGLVRHWGQEHVPGLPDRTEGDVAVLEAIARDIEDGKT